MFQNPLIPKIAFLVLHNFALIIFFCIKAYFLISKVYFGIFEKENYSFAIIKGNPLFSVFL